MRLKTLILALLVLCLIALPAVAQASDVSGALYYGVITVSNNSTLTSYVATTCNISTQVFIDGGFLNATANNSVLRSSSGTDIPFMPGYDTNDWIIWVESIGVNTYLTDIWYTAESSGGHLTYFPGATGHLTADNADMEPADNFTITLNGFFNTTDQNDVVTKGTELLITTTDEGAIVARIDDTTGNIQTPDNGTNDPDAFWGNDGDIDDENIATGADAGNTLEDSWTSYLYSLDTGTVTCSIRTYAEMTADWVEIDVDAYYNAAWNDVYQGAYSNEDWDYWYISTGSENITQVRVRFYNTGTTQVEDNLFREIDLMDSAAPMVLVSANVTADEHEIILAADGVDLTLTVDSVLQDTATLGGSQIDDVGDDWYVALPGMPYMYSSNLTVGGNRKQDIEWEYDATFTDASGQGNDATPSFRTTSSDADVIAELVSFQPISEADAPPYSMSTAPDFITDPPSATGEFTTEPYTSSFPLAGVIKAIADTSSTPSQLPLLIVASFVILAVSLSMSAVIRRYGSGNIFVKIIVICAIMGIFIALREFGIDFWMIVVFAIMSASMAVASQHRWA